MKSKATGCGSISVVLSSIFLLRVSSIIIIIRRRIRRIRIIVIVIVIIVLLLIIMVIIIIIIIIIIISFRLGLLFDGFSCRFRTKSSHCKFRSKLITNEQVKKHFMEKP